MPEIEALRIKHEVEGLGEIQQLQNEILNLEKKLLALSATYTSGSSTTKAYSRDVEQLAVKSSAASRSIAQVQSAAGPAAYAKRNLGMATLEASRAIEDLQFGLVGVINNIPGLVMSLGGSAGLIGIIGLSTVASYQLYKRWDDLMGLFSVGIPQPALSGIEQMQSKVRDLTEEVEGLRAQTSLTFIEFVRLSKAQEELAAANKSLTLEKDFDQLTQLKPEKQRARGQGFRDVVSEYGGGKRMLDTIVHQLSNNEQLAAQARLSTGGGALEEITKQMMVNAAGGMPYDLSLITKAAAGTSLGDLLNKKSKEEDAKLTRELTETGQANFVASEEMVAQQILDDIHQQATSYHEKKSLDESLAETRRHQQQEQLRERQPFIDRRVDLAMQVSALQKGGVGSLNQVATELVDKLAGELEQKGLGGREEAAAIVRDRQLNLMNQFEEAMMAPPKSEFRAVQTLAIGDLARSIQDGAQDSSREQLDVARKSFDALVDIQRAIRDQRSARPRLR
jgi:hypothetical protein